MNMKIAICNLFHLTRKRDIGVKKKKLYCKILCKHLLLGIHGDRFFDWLRLLMVTN